MRLDEAGLERWGRRVGATLTAPAFIALRGGLGAGKSVLARAVGEGAGVRGPMPSPTFNLVFRYPARAGLEVVHLDLFRLESPDELTELGWDELCAEHEIVLVEWPERAAGALPADHWLVDLVVAPGRAGLRDVSVTRVGSPPELAGFPLHASRPGA